ncbi:MAG: prepilin-type N-terminal cleavage/methylation domain-containing protein [Armatimonadetes bacterium]|nr:prepilin-type N-terminal cleavage/methylation domain-containing protein [Armatimonadota bacterium]
MKARNPDAGLTLIEMNVAVVMLAVVMVAVLGIFGAVTTLWERTSTQNDSELTLGEAASRLCSALRNGCHVFVFTRFSTGDSVAITFPAAKTPEGDYSLSKGKGSLVYKPTSSSLREVWYLSDSTGSLSVSGNILWVASTVETADNLTPIKNTSKTFPDAARSLHPGTTVGQVAPVTSLRFDPPAADEPAWYYKVTLTSDETRAGNKTPVSFTRRVYVRNHE